MGTGNCGVPAGKNLHYLWKRAVRITGKPRIYEETPQFLQPFSIENADFSLQGPRNFQSPYFLWSKHLQCSLVYCLQLYSNHLLSNISLIVSWLLPEAPISTSEKLYIIRVSSFSWRYQLKYCFLDQRENLDSKLHFLELPLSLPIVS